MFFRGRQPESSIWRRFRSGVDGFTFLKESDYYQAHVVSTAERMTDLLYALSEHVPQRDRPGPSWARRRLMVTHFRVSVNKPFY